MSRPQIELALDMQTKRHSAGTAKVVFIERQRLMQKNFRIRLPRELVYANNLQDRFACDTHHELKR
jgi:hypothetical protein